MEPYAASLTYLFSVIIVCLDVVVVFLAVSRSVMRMWLPPTFDRVLLRYILPIASVSALMGVLLSLFYSEIVGFPVCVLCWFSRTMLFPYALIASVAWVRRDVQVWPYLLSLSVSGMVITLYHHLYQMGVTAGTLCTTFANGGDCAARYVFEFGFVTMPWMGFTLFTVLAFLAWRMRER
ncbi:MAG: disulfide bond formation protein B [Candidatus Pacebacteria bacterium]|nr:disulfide bond formation protein B [Candidatus Paceibacterota bacterium]